VITPEPLVGAFGVPPDMIGTSKVNRSVELVPTTAAMVTAAYLWTTLVGLLIKHDKVVEDDHDDVPHATFFVTIAVADAE
jgi:hypothetical protein